MNWRRILSGVLVAGTLTLAVPTPTAVRAQAPTITATSNKCSAFSAVSSTTVSCAFPGATTIGSLIAVCVFWDTATDILTNVNDTGNSYTERASTLGTNDSLSAEIVDAINVNTNAQQPQANFSSAVTFKAIYAQEFLGVASSGNGFDKGVVAVPDGIGNSTDAITSGATATRSQANELLWGCGHASNNSPTYSAGTGYTLSQSLVQWGSSEYKVVSSVGTDAATFTSNLTGNNAIVHIATYKDVVAGGGGGGPTMKKQRPLVFE